MTKQASGFRRWRFFVALTLCVATPSLPASRAASNLPLIGPAPTFSLMAATGENVSLLGLRGKVLALTFIYTTCSQSCPVLTAKMADIRRRLGDDFGSRVAFVSITVDPLNDTPARLRDYAAAHGANVAGWRFLTGTPAQITDVVKRYGAIANRQGTGDVDHLYLTSLIDRQGMLRVQYLGYRFDSVEMLRDLQALTRE
jgi:protein SCO1/2